MLSPSSHHHTQHHRFFPSSTLSAETPSTYYYYHDNTSNDSTLPSSTSSSIYHPVPTQAYPPSKRLKVSEDLDFDIPSTYDCPPLVYPTTMPQAVRRPQPVINLHRASEPPSPVTIASTLSNPSTPAPSPSRVTILSDNHSPTDFQLFDEGYALQEHQPKQRLDSRYTPNTSTPSATTATHFNGPFGEFPPSSWAQYSSQQMDLAKLQRQQQQPYYHNSMPAFGNGNGSFGHHVDEEELPALSPSRGNNSRPSISEVDMPATPVHSPVHQDRNVCVQAPAINHNVPKLARTVSDAVQDELFNPGIAPGIAHSQPEHTSDSTSQLPTLFQQAQSQHAMARSTPVKPVTMMREHSPFRANSPFHPARTLQEIVPAPTRTSTAFLNFGAYTSARSRRENDVEREAEALRNKMKNEYEGMQETPKTISPKDAYIEYHEPDGDGIQGSLFSSGQNDDTYSQHSNVDIKSESDRDSYHGSIHGDDDGHQTEHSYDSMATSRRESDVAMGDYSMPIYNGSAQHFGDHLTIPSYGWGEETSSQGSSDASRLSDETYELPSSHLQRPEDTKANDGAYSCTVHGCTQRFSTASKMSKHRREAHRHNTPMGRDAPIKSLLQGPSRCARINPTTGKPCNTIFSRPYDLTRHEDTIHNTARQKVRCEICNDEKTFSRQDALTRHKKVKHGIDK